MSEAVLKAANTQGDLPPMPTRFAFGGAAGDVLRAHFLRDVQQARLSAKFKLYYRLRPLIPIPMRQFLQRGRNQGFDLPTDWYLPITFLRDLDEALRSDPDAVGIHPWPDGFEMSAVLTHDVETKDGLALADRLAKIEEQFNFRSAWNVIPHKYEVDLGLISDLKDRGHEIGVHGYNHDGRLFESHRTFRRRVKPINRAITEFGSEGFRAPMVHRNLAWMEALDIDYDASCFDVDPFQAMPGGVGGPWPFFAGKFIELPYTLPQDHTLLISLGETTPRIWIDKLARLRSLAGMALLITHPDYLDSPSRLDVYRQFLDHLSEQHAVWHALPNEVALWWRQRDRLNIIDGSNGVAGVESAELVGPMAERARTFSLRDLQPG